MTRTTQPAAGVVAALQRPTASGESVQQLPLDRIAANPNNPVRRSTRVEWLALSVASKGILDPLIVVTVDAWLTQHPEHADIIDRASVDHVVVDGHRRLAAGRIAQIATAPALVRNELATDDEETILHTGLHKLSLTPIEQAHSLQRMAERGLSQRAIAEEVGIAQSQVAKRLALLRLPEALQESLQLDLYSVSDALELLAETNGEDGALVLARVGERVRELLDKPLPADDPDAEDDDIKRARRGSVPWQMELRRLRSDAYHALRSERATAAATVVAQELGVEVMASPEETIGYNQLYTCRITTKKDIAAAKKAGTLVVIPTPGRHDAEVGYLDLGRKCASTSGSSSQKSDEEKAQRKAYLAARKARDAHVDKLALHSPTAAEYRAAATAVAIHAGNEYKPRNAAQHLCDAKGYKYPSWQNKNCTAAERERYVWMLWVYWNQNRMEFQGEQPFDADLTAWMRGLVAVGYTPAPWDADKLAEASKPPAAKQDKDATPAKAD